MCMTLLLANGDLFILLMREWHHQVLRDQKDTCIEPSWEKGLTGLVPFVSCRPGAYGRLLLAVYVRWRTGLRVSSDWLRPVTRGSWQTGFMDRGRGLADVS